jgi:hypothetical protein
MKTLRLDEDVVAIKFFTASTEDCGVIRSFMLSLTFFGKMARPKPAQGMSENHAQNDENYSRENQIKHRWPQPSFELFPLLPKKISDQDVSGGVSSRPRKVVKKESAPLHFRDASQQVGHDGREQEDEPRDENRSGTMTFEKLFRPL